MNGVTAAFLFVLLANDAAGQTRMPPRDAGSPAKKGTSVIRGRVVAADTQRPLRRARVSVGSPELGGEAGPPAPAPTASSSCPSSRPVPLGDYFAVAQEYVEERMWNDPEYLAALSDRAIAFRLAAAEAREVPLTLLTPP